MARPAAIDAVSNGAVKRRGRPPATIVDRFDYTVGRQTFQREAAFWAFVRGYPSKDGCSLYLYRLDPVIDNGLIGKDEANIEVIADIDNYGRGNIEETHGGGTYMLKFSDGNASPRERAKGWVRIDDPDIEPKLDIRTLKLNDPKNTDYVARLIGKGVLVRDAAGNPQIKTAAPEVVPTAVAVTITDNGVGNGAAAPAAHGGGYDSMPPGMMNKLLVTLLDRALIPPPPAPAVSPETIVNLGMSLAEKFHAPARPVVVPQELDLLDAYERVRKLVAPVAPPVQVAAGDSPWAAFFASLPSILQMLPTVAAGFAAVQAQRAAAAGAPQGYYAPPGIRPGVAYAPAPAAAPQVATEVVNESSMMFSPSIQEAIGRLLPVAVERFLDGTSGNDFALAIQNLEGELVLRAVEMIPLEAMQSSFATIALGHPALAAKLRNDPDALVAWLNSFLGVEDTAGPAAT